MNKRLTSVRFVSFSFFFVLILGLQAVSCESNPYAQGEILYTNFCASCHMEEGQGLKGLIPPLAQADYLKNNQAKIACIIRNGMEGQVVVNGKTYEQPMQAIPQLSDFEIANVINYINHAWGNDFGYIQIDEVRASLKACPKNK